MCLVRSYLKGVKCTLKTEAFTRFDKKERKGKVLSYNSSIRTIRFSLGLIANDLSKKRKMMIQLSGAGGTKEAFAVQYKEYKSLVNKISSIFEQKRLTYTIRTKLKNAPKQAVYDFSFEECDLNLWEKKFYHVTQVVLGMINLLFQWLIINHTSPLTIKYRKNGNIPSWQTIRHDTFSLLYEDERCRLYCKYI